MVCGEAGASASWASAGASMPVASATAAEITRNLAFMLTHSADGGAARFVAATQRLLPPNCRDFKHMLDERQATGDEKRRIAAI